KSGDGDEDLIVLISARWRPALFAEDTNDAELQAIHADPLTDRVWVIRKKLAADGLSNEADGGHFLDVVLVVETAGNHVPIADVLHVGHGADNGGRPFTGARQGKTLCRLHTGSTHEQGTELLADRIGIFARQRHKVGDNPLLGSSPRAEKYQILANG